MSQFPRCTTASALVLTWALTACATTEAMNSTTDPMASTSSALLSAAAIQISHTTVTGGLWLVPVSDAVMTAAAQGQAPSYQSHPVWVGKVANQAMAVIGLGLSDAGEQALLTADGQLLASTQVLDRAYAEQHLTLTQTQYVNPDQDQLARFEREAAEQKAAYRVYSTTGAATWPRFQWPLEGRISSLFGLRRFFNGEPRAPHLGIDIAGTLGAPVHAPARGRVVLVGDYFFNGRTVIIDHGQGLFSMLCHFSDIRVKTGDQVTPESIVGLVGATGRATAPHLHWTVSLNDSRIDPRRLLVAVPETDRATD